MLVNLYGCALRVHNAPEGRQQQDPGNYDPFRAEFFNILNHPNLAAPNFLNDANNSIFAAGEAPIAKAGVIGSTSTEARRIQLGLKLIW